MSHAHEVYDTDKHFLIDPITREISTESTKLVLIQKDHNSERYTFEVPRMIEGHDMSLCNQIQVHYDNISRDRRQVNSDFYTVTDMQVSEKDDETILFSWLISDSSTQIVGKLNFAVHFACVSSDGEEEYAWHTASYSKVEVKAGIHSTETVLTEHSDFVSRMEMLANDALGAIVGYADALNEVVAAVNTADKYIGEYEYDEMVFDFKQEDWTVDSKNDGMVWIETDTDLSFIVEHNREQGFYIDFRIDVEDAYAFEFQLTPSIFALQSQSGPDGSEITVVASLLSGVPVMVIPGYSYDQTPREQGGLIVVQDLPSAPTKFQVHKTTRSLAKRVGDILDEINGEVI